MIVEAEKGGGMVQSSAGVSLTNKETNIWDLRYLRHYNYRFEMFGNIGLVHYLKWSQIKIVVVVLIRKETLIEFLLTERPFMAS